MAAVPVSFSQAEIEHLDLTRICDHDVGRLQIPMDDPGGMRGGESVGNLDGVFQGLRAQAFPWPESVAIERLAGHVLHHDEVDAVGRRRCRGS
jgi:hypothetical protein